MYRHDFIPGSNAKPHVTTRPKESSIFSLNKEDKDEGKNEKEEDINIENDNINV